MEQRGHEQAWTSTVANDSPGVFGDFYMLHLLGRGWSTRGTLFLQFAGSGHCLDHGDVATGQADSPHYTLGCWCSSTPAEGSKMRPPPGGLVLEFALQKKHTAQQETGVASGHLTETLTPEPFLAALQNESTFIWKVPIQVMEYLGDTRAVEPLLLALQDEDRRVRWSAIMALTALGDAQAVDMLLAALYDENKAVRAAATEALGRLCDGRAVSGLRAALRDEQAYVQEPGINGAEAAWVRPEGR
jgi:hypothetical protein